MALIKCVECNKELSEKAPACPHCGCPNNQIKCPECSAFVDDAIDTCPTCGYPFKASTPVQPAAPPVSTHEPSKSTSSNSSAGCFTAIGAVLIIICMIVTAGHPVARVFWVFAIIIGVAGAVAIKDYCNR